jgi:pimeloyl-ACP methyl ester carboxylesterase
VTDFTVWPPKDSPVSVTTWLREIAELTKVTASPPPFPENAARGKGEAVIVLPGFCSPDQSTARLREFLARQGFAPRPWECGPNLGPMRSTLKGLERQLDETAEQHGPVALVGISLGGTIAREMAKRRPDCVRRVITLVSPVKLPVATPLSPLAQFASLVWDGDARKTFASIAEPPPVPLTAIVSPKDGVVDWRACVPDSAPGVEMVIVEGAHMTIGSNPEAQRIVASRLVRQ